VFSYLKPTVTLKRLGRTLAASLLLEVAVIFAQAFRGTTSQFILKTAVENEAGEGSS